MARIMIGSLAAGLALSAALTACGGSSTTTSTKPGVVSSLRALVPQAIQKKGVLEVATGLDFPPYTFKTASGQATGIEPELLEEIGKELGLRVVFNQVGFPSLIPSIKNGRYQIGLDQLGDLPIREESIDFVDYLKGSDTLLTQKGNPSGISPTDMCGKSVALVVGTGEVPIIQGYSKTCTADGKPAITLDFYQTSAAQALAVENGRADAAPVEVAVAAYLAKNSSGKTETLKNVLPDFGYTVGIGVEKGIGLTPAIKAAVQHLMSDGAYMKLLTVWGATFDAIGHVVVNDPNAYQTDLPSS
jgi:polar amino acid transport system substrate-binding protein